MAQATTPGPFNTAYASHLEGVDFIGKTGTAQIMSHAALARSGGGFRTRPNSWFVGMVPRRNPDIVVAILWENGDWGSNSAKLGAQIINTFVEKQRKRANNIRIAEAPRPSLFPAPATLGQPDGEPAPTPSQPAQAPNQPGTPLSALPANPVGLPRKANTVAGTRPVAE